MLRYFKNKSASEIAALLHISDEAAQKRVTRAVERLRKFFIKRGLSISSAGIVITISTHAVEAAPIGLAVTIASKCHTLPRRRYAKWATLQA